ncbi:ubiquitin carboxyl-terminal hydrolase [Collybia nuda]|uniref:Ubiquitin carboxyl-terminal hydrolase n=1 Tax=Collybia nuda TaxID=64659 RepID=A0A9P5Y0G2_9AGAR|nr:ubiquitin carboxyl-terminal hydrolase [Collybia nuda]
MAESNGAVKTHRKAYLPLESNPQVFTQLINNLGVTALEFQDVFSVDEPELLAMVSRPVYALVLVFPTTPMYEEQIAKEEATRDSYTGSGAGEDVIWFEQTIYNACGLYGILHSVSNGDAANFIEPGSALARLLATCVPLAPHERALALEASEELEIAHATAGVQGDTAAPASAEDVVDYHYVAFIKSKSGHIYEMDGCKKGPVNRGAVLSADEDILSESALKFVREYIHREKDGNVNFSLMALVRA